MPRIGSSLGRDRPAVAADVDLGGPGGRVAPHPADLLDAAGAVACAAVLRPRRLEQRVEPLVDVPERLAQEVPSRSDTFLAPAERLWDAGVVRSIRSTERLHGIVNPMSICVMP